MKLKTMVYIGVVILIVCVIPFYLYYYNFNLRLGVSALSKNSADWGDFGSFIGGSLAILTSIISSATLAFLIYQHVSTAKQQQQFTKQQIEMMVFQKYREHQQEFFSLLDDLEGKPDYPVRFVNRHDLYKSIFPGNDYEECQYQISDAEFMEGEGEGEGEGENHPLAGAMALVRELKKCFALSESNIQSGDNIVDKVRDLQKTLNFSPERGEKENDFVMAPNEGFRRPILNIKDVGTTAYNLERILNELLLFARRKTVSIEYHNASTSYVIKSLEYYSSTLKGNGFILFIPEESKEQDGEST